MLEVALAFFCEAFIWAAAVRTRLFLFALAALLVIWLVLYFTR